MRSGPVSAASAASRSTGSVGMWTCGVVARTGMPSGTPPAWSPGTCGWRRAIMHVSSSAYSNDAAPRPAGGCGRPPRSITGPAVPGVARARPHAVTITARLLGRTEPAGHQSRRAFGEMRRGSTVPSHGRGRRRAGGRSLMGDPAVGPDLASQGCRPWLAALFVLKTDINSENPAPAPGHVVAS
jgi:hypothetical protein